MASKNEFIVEAKINAQSAVNELNYIFEQGTDAAEKYYDKVAALAGKKITFTPAVRYEVDANGFQRPVAYLKEQGNLLKDVYSQQERLNRVQEGSLTNLRQQVNYYKQQRDELVRLTTTVDQYGRQVKTVNPAWDEANRKVQALSKQLEIAGASSFWQRIKAEFNLGPILGAGKALNEIVNTFQSLSIVVGQITAPINELANALDGLQQTELLFKGIGQGPAEIARVFSDSANIATTYGVSLKTVREGFTQLTPVVTASGGSMEDVSSIINALSSRFTTFGLSADKSRRVMNGVIQAFGKGKLMAEELTQQISEADPAFKTDLANAIGVTVSQLGEMVKAGEITSEVLIEILPLLGKNSQFFGKMGESASSAVAALGRGQATISQVQNQLATLSQLNLEALGQLFKPLLGAFLQVQAATIDFITQLRQLETVKLLIDVFNGVAQILATVFTAFTQLTVAIIKVVDPIAAAIRAFDDWTQSFSGIRAATAVLAALLTVQLYNAIYGIAVALLPKAIAAFTNLGISITAVTVSSIREFIASIGKTVSSIAGYIANIAVVVSGNAAMAASHDAVAAAAGRQAAAQAAANGTPYLQGAASVVGANNAVAASSNAAATANGKAVASLAKSGPLLAGLALIGVGVAGMWNDYTQRIKYAKEATEGFRSDADAINKAFAEFAASAQQATNDADSFGQRLKQLAEQGRDRNAFEFIVDVFFETDVKSAAAIRTLTNDLKKEFDGLQGGINNARDAIKDYNTAQAANSKNNEFIKQQVLQQVKLLDALIQRSIQAREAELKRAQANGAGVRQDELIEFQKLQKEIDKFRKMRDDLINEAESKGIVLDVKVETEGEEKVFTTVGALQEELKSIKDSAAVAKVGETGTAETQQKIKALDGLLKFISEDPVEVEIKARFDLDKAAIASQIEYGQAMLDNVKSRASVEDSIFGVYKARNNYAISAAQEELKTMKDRGASAEAIKRKEDEIARLKDNERKIEQNAIAVKLQNIGKEQALESGVLDLKQQGQRLEGQLAITTAERLATEARIAKVIADQNYLKAKQTKDPTDDGPARKLVELTGQYVDLAEDGVTAAKNRYSTLLQTQSLERDTLKNQQAAARNNLSAQAAQLGLNSTISGGSTAYGQLNREAVGFISAGGKTVQIYNEVGNSLSGNLKSAEELNAELRALPSGQNLDLTVSGTLDAQSINNAISQGQRALNQPSNFLTAPLAPSVNTVSFVNEVKQAIAQVQSSDATRVTAQLVVNGQGMAAASIDSLTNAVDTYTTRVGIANQAQGQLQAAISQYNEALQSGDPGRIMETAGALQYQREVVAGANFDLQNSKVALQDAQAIAQVLGVDIGAVGTQASVAAGEVSGIGQSMSNAAEQGNLLSQSADSVATSIADVDTSAQNTAQNIADAGDNLGRSWTTALQEAAGGVNDLQTDISYIGQEVSSLSGETDGLATGFSTADSSAGGLYNTTKAIVGELQSDEAGTFADYLGEASGNAEGVADSGFDAAALNASDAGGAFDSSLQSASSQADEIYNTLSNIDSLSPTVEVNVVGTPGRFAGGPVDPGQTYRVNELGKEAFLSASGRLSMINKPRNGLWRAPSRGTVIPAHLTSNLDIPSGGVNLASGASARVSRAASGVSGVANMTRALAQALRASGLLETNSNVAVQQAGQAAQLGKLTHAVNKLADKDWNVHVNVKNPGASTYMDLMNRMS